MSLRNFATAAILLPLLFLGGTTAQTSELTEADICYCDNGSKSDNAATKVCCSNQMDGNDNLKIGLQKECEAKTTVEDGGMGVDADVFKSCCLDQGVGDSEKSATCVEG